MNYYVCFLSIAPAPAPAQSGRVSLLSFSLADRSQHAAVRDHERFARLPPPAAELFHRLHDVFVPFDHLAEDDVFPVEMRRLRGGYEKLRAVRPRARVRHGQQTRLGVFHLEVFVVELLAVDGLAAGAVAVGEVAALAHEMRNDAVEARPLVRQRRLPVRRRALIAEAQVLKVIARLRRRVPVETERHAPERLAVRGDVEEASVREGHVRRHVVALEEKLPRDGRTLLQHHAHDPQPFLVSVDLPVRVVHEARVCQRLLVEVLGVPAHADR
mmetsp:Transcript_2510/g.8033  ORF Transcript_2510/g.8033 Transcript_2510/m.8033 type:complete len:271 (-) Transcript_2510:176-988(-)